MCRAWREGQRAGRSYDGGPDLQEGWEPGGQLAPRSEPSMIELVPERPSSDERVRRS
jgi:hypothetical protein